MNLLYGFIAGIFVGGTASYLYANYVIAEYKQMLDRAEQIIEQIKKL